MAIAIVSAAKVILPVLYDGYQKHEKIVSATKQCETSLSKAEELLSLEVLNSTENIDNARTTVEEYINAMTVYLQEMSKTLPEALNSNQTEPDTAKPKSMMGKALDIGAKVISKVADSAKTSIEAVLIDRIAELSKLNSDLLVACVDLSLAIQRQPPKKSAFCIIT